VEEAIEKANYYLKNEALREKIALAGQEKVLKYHTYENRLSNMMNVALKHSPKLAVGIKSENKKLDDFLRIADDKELEMFLQGIEPGARFLYEKIINEVYKSQGTLKSYEAFLMLLDTFFSEV